MLEIIKDILVHPRDASGRSRSLFDTCFFVVSETKTPLGGLVATPGITNANFYSMIEIVAVTPDASNYFLHTEDGQRLPRNQHALLPGRYQLVTSGTVALNQEPVLVRTCSRSNSGPRTSTFTDAVRKRDKRCVITKRENAARALGLWAGFEAAHIFPLAHEAYWNAHDFGRYISLPPATGRSINSVQNGLLLDTGVHQLFDSYYFAANPDDGYKVVCFLPDSHGIAGTQLDRQLLDDRRRPSDELLRWHFRQAVLANVRGVGEPLFESDFPPGSDVISEIIGEPKAAERMEAELFGRFASIADLDPAGCLVPCSAADESHPQDAADLHSRSPRNRPG